MVIENDVKAVINEIERKYDKLDVMANMVGGCIGGKTIEVTTLRESDYMININLKAAFLLATYAVYLMKARSNGKIAHVSSATGERVFGNDTVYSASKAGSLI